MAKVFRNLDSFTAEKAWGAEDILNVEGASVRVHWTDKPYKWHVNDGNEVFVVLQGHVDMDYKEGGQVRTANLGPNDIFTAESGD